jgi:hypothetical protein
MVKLRKILKLIYIIMLLEEIRVLTLGSMTLHWDMWYCLGIYVPIYNHIYLHWNPCHFHWDSCTSLGCVSLHWDL